MSDVRVIKSFTVKNLIQGADSNDSQGEFLKAVRYLNYTNEIMKVRDRSGFIITLNPAYCANYTGKDGLVVRVELQMNQLTAQDNYDRIIAKPQEERDLIEMEFFKEFSTGGKHRFYRTNFVVYLLIEKATLLENGGVNYLEPSDGTLYIGPGLDMLNKKYPPGSTAASLKRFEKMCKDDKHSEYYDSSGLMYALRIIDNDSVVRPTYYVNILNGPVPVKAIVDPDMKNGIYLLQRVGGGSGDKPWMRMEHFDINDRAGCFIPVYDTCAQALQNFSHPDIVRQVELAHEQRARTGKAELEERLATEKLRAERLRIEQEQERYRQEQTSQKRKNTFEFIKYGPMILNAAIVLITLVMSIVAKKPIKPVKI